MTNKVDLSHAFHAWRHENEVTKLFMEYITKERDVLLSQLVNLSKLNIPSQDKLIYLGGISDCFSMLVSILNLGHEALEDIANAKY